MRQSFFAVQTDMSAPADAESTNAKYLTQGGFIKKESAGVYSYLPMGFRVLKKIEEIVREEMNSVQSQEILMPELTPRENWEKTGRTETEIAYTPTKSTVLAWSHEEMVTPIAKTFIRSYKDLPLSLYHIQTKFRNEPRAKSGLLRGREFLMKDAYSFHSSQEDMDEYYEKIAAAYTRVYERCGLKSYRITSGGGAFSDQLSDEFSVITPAGEDIMILCEACRYAKNSEVAEGKKKGDACPDCGKPLDEEKCVEVGNIFYLGTKYTEAFKINITDKDGGKLPVLMGCYGIGVSRLMGTIVEASHDENGIIWPASVAPFHIHILSLREDEKAEELSRELEEDGYEVLFDDRDETPGKKFADSDLFGIPLRIVISKRTLEKESAEVRIRVTGETFEIPLKDIPKFAWEFFEEK